MFGIKFLCTLNNVYDLRIIHFKVVGLANNMEMGVRLRQGKGKHQQRIKNQQIVSSLMKIGCRNVQLHMSMFFICFFL